MDLITALFDLNPLWVLVTLLGGLGVGFVTKGIPIEKKTIYALLLLYLPFAVSRLLLVLLFGLAISSGTGYIGALFFNIYLIGIIVGRKLGNKFKGV